MITRFVPAAPSRSTRAIRLLVLNGLSEIRVAQALSFTHPGTNPQPPGSAPTNSLNLLKRWVGWVRSADFHQVAKLVVQP
jgi:hypothetical protein